ncbi:MAG: glycosyltransferase family 4 protein [Planctomycetota bacterium]|nr:glycosyltransferase family 4 protein [Planctomycetota bacterium]
MAEKGPDKAILIFSQVYPPDPASVGQHMADVAEELASRGRRVRVITANRGYDDASKKYAAREMRNGVEVRRVPLSSFGKKSIPLRAMAMMFYMLQCLWAGLFTRRVGGIVVSTSPPMCGFAAGFVNMVRRTPITYWVMDLNPDQMIELGMLKSTSITARMLNALQKFVLKRSAAVVALDRFMAERLNKKRDVSAKMTVMPPWPHEGVLDVVPHEENWFREKQGLNGSFVFMYSGNHTYSNPVTTILEAAQRMEDDEGIVFLFIGGGLHKKDVDKVIAEKKPKNIRSLPYQPLEDLRYSLSAADCHIVTVGDPVVGVVHPCKIYGAMAVARPILVCGPAPSHASDIIEKVDAGWHIRHGDVEGAIRVCREIAATGRERLNEMGRTGQGYIRDTVGKEALCGRFCDIVESTLK